MKKIAAICITLLSLTFTAEAGNKKKKCEATCVKTEKAINTDSIAQQIAINLGDYNTAITFAYKDLAKNPKSIDKTFRLARLYYLSQKFQLSLNVCGSILSVDSLNGKTMELAALNFKGLKNSESAAGIYKMMAERLNNITYLYQAAVVEFEANKLEDCLKTLNTLSTNPNVKKQSIEMSRKNAARQIVKEQINLLAAAHNITGFIALQNKDLKKAEAYFMEALAIEPGFVLAENNLKEIMVLKNEKLKPQPEKK